MAERRSLLGPLWARPALAFLVVALGALAVLSGLVIWAAERDVEHLVEEEHQLTIDAAADALTASYASAGDWESTDLDAAHAIADEAGARVTVLGANRELVSVHDVDGRSPGGMVLTRPIVVGGREVGELRLQFDAAALPSPAQNLRDALLATVAAGTGLAALLALVVAVGMSRHITRPLEVMTKTVRMMEAGDRTARVGHVSAPGELGELASAFDRMADALAHGDALRRALVADVAHELRTPLTIVRASLEGIADGVVVPTHAELASLRDDVLRLERIVSDLETLAAAEAAALTLVPERVDLAEIADAAAVNLRPRFDEAGVELTTALTSVIVDGDPGRLHQVVTNLLTNAMKFTPPPGEVRLDVFPVADTAVLEVTDTGIGIAHDELPRVFDRFWRGGGGGATGSGIGLTVVAELVRAHRGGVSIDSEEGRGTQLRVTLPRVDSNSIPSP